MLAIRDLGFDQCYDAASSRDPRFDGLFIVGVHTTGIYCRPSCPAPVRPKRTSVAFYRSTAAAQLAGLRACKRCRPDAVPGSPEWDARGDLVGRAMRLIADGVVDREGVGAVARRLAVSERHLQRLLVDEVGAPALALARSQRAQTARILAETTELPFTDVAAAAGFRSVRQFNDTVRAVFAASPTQLRAARARGGDGASASGAGRLTLRLALRPPYDRGGMLRWLQARAIPGVEDLDLERGTYRRTLALPGGPAVASVTLHDDHVATTLALAGVADLAGAVARLRRLLDLDADPHAAGAVLAADPALAPLVAANPGLRVPGSVAPHETAIRAILGQQVSVAAARTLAGRLVAIAGTPLEAPDGTLTHAFPTAEQLADADLSALGMPAGRRATLTELSARVADGRLDLGPGADRATARAELLDVPGVGPWTAGYVALRGLGDPDAFPAGDLVLVRAAARLGIADTTRALAAASERWRPWRAYAAHHLWSAV